MDLRLNKKNPGGPAPSLSRERSTMGQETFFYSGKATKPGHGWKPADIFKYRYRRYSGGAVFESWVNVPGTNMQVKVRVPVNEESVRMSAVFTGTGRPPHDLLELDGKTYQMEDLLARGVERENFKIHNANGKSMNKNNPVSDDLLNEALDLIAPKTPRCWRKGLY